MTGRLAGRYPVLSATAAAASLAWAMGDLGVGLMAGCNGAATLTIDDAGDWHIAYVDGFDEELKYMRLANNGKELVGIEVVDDGAGTDTDVEREATDDVEPSDDARRDT